MEPQFEELAERLTKNITDAVTRDVTAAVTRNVTEEVTRNVTEVVNAAERRLTEQARINVEAVKAEARLAAEGYAATVESIERRLGSIEKKIDTNFLDHDKVLKEHGERITALEKHRH
jgi:uncharacterized protein with PIN domain